MKPNPISPSYLHDEYSVEDDADNDSPDTNSKLPPTISSSPRRLLPDEDGMDVGGGSDEEQSTNTSPQGSKRTRQEYEESEDQEDIFISTEPVTKKRCTHETAASSTSVSHSSDVRNYQNLQQLVKWTCEHLLEKNHDRAFRIGDTFNPNTFDQFRNALERATQSNAPELVQKLFETGMQHCVPEVLDAALALATSVGAHDVVALLNHHRLASHSPLNVFDSSSSTASASTSTVSISTLVAPLSGLEPGWQKRVRLDLSQNEIVELMETLSKHQWSARLNTLIFGEKNLLKGKFDLKLIPEASEKMLVLLEACGAVCLHKRRKVVMLSSDFDRDKFLAGLLTIQKEEQNAAENLAEGIPNSLFSALMLAALLGDQESVVTLLDNGAIPIAVDANNKNALMFAAEIGHLEIVRLLLNFDMNLNAASHRGETALGIAALGRHYSVCQLLLQSGARLDIVSKCMPLHLAANNGDAELCELFIYNGADINQTDSEDNTPLFCAVKNQQLTVCKLLVKLGADINFRNSSGTILLMAVSNRNTQLVEYLLDQGAEVDVTPYDFDCTPLIAAAERNQIEIIKLLLDRGAQIDRIGEMGSTALFAACSYKNLEAAKLLLQRGANPNEENKYGSSILDTAAESGHDEIVKLLIKHGVTLFSQRNEGFRALKLAVKKGRVSTAQLLLAANVPAEMVIDKQASSLLIIAMQSLSGKSLVDMLTLLLQQKISLRKTDDKGNDALMLAVKTKQFEALKILILHGATIGQINKKGQNALAIAIDALDLILQILKLEIPPQEPEQEIPLEEPEQQISLLTNMLGDLLTRAQNQPDWLVLRKDAINRAQCPFTREIILVSWAWPLVAGNFPLNDLAKKNINFVALHDFIQFVINSTSTVTREKIIYMLGMAGLCPPLIENMGPYIEGLTQIKSQLFGNSATGHDQTISTFIAVLEATVVKIPLKLGEQWNAYTGEISNTPVGIALNQIANAELDSCMAMSFTVESEHTTAVFKTLFETCFNLSVTETSLPATFPAFAAAPGVVADTLMAKGVYSALAIKIETAWKSIWALFEGTEMSNASSTTSNATSNATSFLKSPRGQILLMTFKSKLSIRIFEIAQAPNVTPEAAILYSVLMQRQLNMLWQFIQTE